MNKRGPVVAEPPILSGTLGPVGLAGVLQLIESELLTGKLFVPGAVVQLRRGQVVAVKSHKQTEGIVGMRDAFMGDNGPFQFVMGEVVETVPLGLMMVLIMDACRVADDWARLAPLCLGPGKKLVLEELESPISDLVEHLDGTIPVWQALKRADVSAARITDTLLTLRDNGWLRERSPPVPEPREAAPTEGVAIEEPEEPEESDGPELDEYELLEQGRNHLRERAYDEARACFQRALAVAPDNRLVRQNIRRLDELLKKRRRKNV